MGQTIQVLGAILILVAYVVAQLKLLSRNRALMSSPTW
jgi:hypothetical protein